VDAGAQGLVHLLGGITSFIANGRIRDIDRFTLLSRNVTIFPARWSRTPLPLLHPVRHRGGDIDAASLRVSSPGWETPHRRGSSARAKIHLHSNSPAQAFRRVDRHGRIASQRIEDMTAQYRAAHVPHRDIALVVDSSCDLPPDAWERHNIHMVPCQLIFNGRTYLDKLSITPTYFSPCSAKPGAATPHVPAHAG